MVLLQDVSCHRSAHPQPEHPIRHVIVAHHNLLTVFIWVRDEGQIQHAIPLIIVLWIFYATRLLAQLNLSVTDTREYEVAEPLTLPIVCPDVPAQPITAGSEGHDFTHRLARARRVANFHHLIQADRTSNWREDLNLRLAE